MKKSLLFLLLTIIGASSMPANARWDLGDQKGAADIKVGDTIALEFCVREDFMGRYLQGSKLGDAGIISDENVYIVEAGPADVRTGAPTIYLKQLSSGSYLTYTGGWSTISYSADPAQAANLQVISCGEDIPWATTGAWDNYKDGYAPDGTTKLADDNNIANWRNPGGGRLSTDKSVGFSYSPSETEFTYLGSWSDASNIWFWGYTDTNQWNVYTLSYAADLQGDLQSLIDQYSAFSPIGGTEPGYYQQDAADNYNSVLQNAVTMLVTGGTDQELRDVISSLRTAHDVCADAVIPINEGYYYIVSAYDEFMNTQGVEKAVYANEEDGRIWWGTYNENDGTQVFKITPTADANQFSIQNYFTDLYAGDQESWTGDAAYTDLTTTLTPQRLTCEAEGMWLWSSVTWSYPGGSNGKSPFGPGVNGAAVNGRLAAWARVNNDNDQEYIFTNHTNLWYIRPVSDEVLSQLAPAKAQYELTQQLSALVDEANVLYSKLFTFDIGTEGLITVAGLNSQEQEISGNQIRYSNRIHDQKEGAGAYTNNYAYLIDGKDRTYISGSRGYVEVELPSPQSCVTFSMLPRYGNGSSGDPDSITLAQNERPDQISIYASNSIGEGAVFTKVASGEVGSIPLPANFTVMLDTAYRYFRYNVDSDVAGNAVFCISEFQVYPTTTNQQTSQYYATEGLKDKADAMKGLLPQMRAVVAANTASQENITALTQAIAAVRALYADTTELASLIANCQTLLNGVQVGTGMGQLSSQALATALQTAITSARATAFVSPISVEAVRTATTSITTARNAFLAGLKTPEQGKWYFITNMDTERTGEAGAEDAQCGGSAIYLNDKHAGSSVTKWGLYDAASQTLNADNNPAAMWRIVLTDSANNYYAIQNLYTGYYLGDYAGDNINLPVSETPVPYEIAYSGDARFTLYPRGGANKNDFSLWPEGAANDVVCHATGSSASGWTFVEIDPEAQEAIAITDFAMNLIDVMAVPYNISNLASYNDDVQTYAIRKITQTQSGDSLISTIELYQKDDFQAGEPCIIRLGNIDPSVETEDYSLLIPFPTDIVDHTHSFVSNGIVGSLHNTQCGQGTGISTGKEFIPVGEGGSGFDAQTGVIDPSTYTGEVQGVETALTLTVVGLKALPSTNKTDVNGDGEINSADIAVVYNYIANGDGSGYTQTAVDVNGDGVVNASDVATIYTQITGESASSKAFFAKILKMLEK